MEAAAGLRWSTPSKRIAPEERGEEWGRQRFSGRERTHYHRGDHQPKNDNNRKRFSTTLPPRRVQGVWAGQRFHLGKKEATNAELFAIRRAMRIF